MLVTLNPSVPRAAAAPPPPAHPAAAAPTVDSVALAAAPDASRVVEAPAPRLDPQARAAFVACYRALTPDRLRAKAIPSLPLDIRFVAIDVTERLQPAGFRHTTTVLVPYGFLGHLQNPNQATEFYVTYGPCTNHGPQAFGPFSRTASPAEMPPHNCWDPRTWQQ